MKDSLKTIQTISKIAGILSKVIMIFSIVLTCLCIVSIVTLTIGHYTLFTLGGINIKGIIQDTSGLTSVQLYIVMALSSLHFAVTALVAGFAANYFKNEQSAGTPFTLSGAKELFNLGIITAVTSVGYSFISSVVASIGKIENDVSVLGQDALTIGIFFIALSLILKCATEKISESEKAGTIID